MRLPITLLILSCLPFLAMAEEPPFDLPGLTFSWSATSQQDTLYASASGWTHGYLWVHPSPLRNDVVGVWGTLFQTAAVQVHGWRYLGGGGGEDQPWDPFVDESRIIFLDAICEDDKGPRVIAEFDVWIDTDMLDLPGFKPSLVGIRAEGLSSLDPLVFYRVNADDPCGIYSEGFAAETNRLAVKAQPTAVQGSTFGSFKAIYR